MSLYPAAIQTGHTVFHVLISAENPAHAYQKARHRFPFVRRILVSVPPPTPHPSAA